MGEQVSRAVQFRGIDAVIAAFDNIREMNWALFNGKTMLEKYDGQDETVSHDLFVQYVKGLSNSATTSIYRLQTYEDLPEKSKIKPSTEPDRSFNFTLFDAQTGYSPNGPYVQNQAMDKLMAKMEAIESKLAIMESDDDKDEDQMSGIGSILGKLMEMPAVQQKIGELAENFMDKILPTKRPQPYVQPTLEPTAATMNGVPSAEESSQAEKINQALSILWEVDKQLGDNLLKVAAIAKSSPTKYRNLISML